MDLYDTMQPGEGGEARFRRAMARAERMRRRRRGYALTAGATVAILLVVVALGALARELTSAAAAQVVRVEPLEAPAASPAPESALSAPATRAAVASDATVAAPPAPEPTPTPTPPPAQVPKAAPRQAASSAVQRIRIGIGAAGYEPSTVSARAGAPIALTIGKGEGCAAGFILPSLGVEADNSSGPVTVKLGRLKPGTYRFTCGMGMVEGTLHVR